MPAITTAHPGPATAGRPVPWRSLAWVTLRQRRTALIGVSALLIMAIIQNDAYAAVTACHPAAAVRCQQLARAFSRTYWGGGGSVLQSGGAQTVSSLMFALPVLLGAFVGAPLIAREFDSGTFRFAWTQGAGRTRWAISTLLFPALALTAITGAFTALFFWYFRPFLADGQVSEMLPLAFALLGVAFAAWTLFAYAVAAFTGTLLRRTVPAMAVTLVVYIALALVTATSVRAHYATPVTESGWNGSSGAAWVISSFVKAPDGQILDQPAIGALSRRLPASVQNSSSPDAFTDWLTRHGYTQWQSVQPDSRFWRFQLTEGGWLLAASAVLIAGSVGLVRRRGALPGGCLAAADPAVSCTTSSTSRDWSPPPTSCAGSASPCYGGSGLGTLPPVTGHIGDWVLGAGGSLPANEVGNSWLYQPADRFWTFQFIEAGMFVALAAAALGAMVWLLHRRAA
jgi:hypothetical protein